MQIKKIAAGVSGVIAGSEFARLIQDQDLDESHELAEIEDAVRSRFHKERDYTQRALACERKQR